MHKNKTIIKNIHARQILDARGRPTVEVDVWADNNVLGRAAVPSGASTGEHEALELRDGDEKAYWGRGVSKAVKHVNTLIRDELVGLSVFDQDLVDQRMIMLDGTSDKSYLGANAILGVSVAIAKAAAATLEIPLFQYLGGKHVHRLPTPMMNVINGGMHADNPIEIQEFMIVPIKAHSFSQALRMGTEVCYQLGSILKKKGLSTNVGDEGGFAPNIQSHEGAIKLILEAIGEAGYESGIDFGIAIDAASATFYNVNKKQYTLGKKVFSASDLVEFWKDLVARYPVISIEDGMSENDWEGWHQLTEALGKKIQLVGDDLFVTNIARLQQGIDQQIANAILIKMNQIGTLSETLAAVRLAEQHGYRNVISHRSGETEDSTIADLAVAWNTGQIKTGAPIRSDRTAKYNQLLRIEELLGNKATYAGSW